MIARCVFSFFIDFWSGFRWGRGYGFLNQNDFWNFKQLYDTPLFFKTHRKWTFQKELNLSFHNHQKVLESVHYWRSYEGKCTGLWWWKMFAFSEPFFVLPVEQRRETMQKSRSFSIIKVKHIIFRNFFVTEPISILLDDYESWDLALSVFLVSKKIHHFYPPHATTFEEDHPKKLIHSGTTISLDQIFRTEKMQSTQ